VPLGFTERYFIGTTMGFFAPISDAREKDVTILKDKKYESS
jgi:hypothetical protein